MYYTYTYTILYIYIYILYIYNVHITCTGKIKSILTKMLSLNLLKTATTIMA